MAATTRQRLAALEAEVAELRQAVVWTTALGDAIESRGYEAGRASILGGSSGHAARPPQAPLPAAAFDPEAARKFGEARRASLDRSQQSAYLGGHRGRPRHLRVVDGGAS